MTPSVDISFDFFVDITEKKWLIAPLISAASSSNTLHLIDCFYTHLLAQEETSR